MTWLRTDTSAELFWHLPAQILFPVLNACWEMHRPPQQHEQLNSVIFSTRLLKMIRDQKSIKAYIMINVCFLNILAGETLYIFWMTLHCLVVFIFAVHNPSGGWLCFLSGMHNSVEKFHLLLFDLFIYKVGPVFPVPLDQNVTSNNCNRFHWTVYALPQSNLPLQFGSKVFRGTPKREHLEEVLKLCLCLKDMQINWFSNC